MIITHVFAVDQAGRSGWALHDRKHFLLHGTATTALGRKAALDQVLERVPLLERLLVVIEDHAGMPIERKAKWSRDPVTGETQGPQRGTATILGMGDARGRWLEQLELLHHPKRLVMRVEPSVWRRVLGTRCNLSTEAWKAQACMWSSAASGTPIRDDNEAEAMCMAAWGAHDGVMRMTRSA